MSPRKEFFLREKSGAIVLCDETAFVRCLQSYQPFELESVGQCLLYSLHLMAIQVESTQNVHGIAAKPAEDQEAIEQFLRRRPFQL